jgi:hypothetical protein
MSLADGSEGCNRMSYLLNTNKTEEWMEEILHKRQSDRSHLYQNVYQYLVLVSKESIFGLRKQRDIYRPGERP